MDRVSRLKHIVNLVEWVCMMCELKEDLKEDLKPLTNFRANLEEISGPGYKTL